MFPYLLLFTVLFRSLVGVSHHPALFSLSSPLPSLLAGPHTSPKFILLFSSFSPFSVQTSHETPKSILEPMHPRWQRLLSPRKEEGKCFHLHLYYKKRLLSVHVLRSQILLVQWCVYDATFSPKLLWVVGGCHDEIWNVYGDIMESGQGDGDWRVGVGELGHIWAETTRCARLWLWLHDSTIFSLPFYPSLSHTDTGMRSVFPFICNPLLLQVIPWIWTNLI